MSERPDDIAEWAWDVVAAEFYAAGNDHDAWGELEKLSHEWAHGLQSRLARALLKAREEAFVEVLNRLAKESKRYDRNDPHDTAYAVAAAIRQHSQKGER